MKNNTLFQNLLVCSGVLFLNTGILKAQTTSPVDSMNRIKGTEQEYINKDNDQMDEKIKNNSVQDTARMMNHDMDQQQMENRQMDKSQMENQRMHSDTSKMQKEMIRSNDDKKPLNNDPKLNTATPPKTTQMEPAKQDNIQIKQTRTTTTTTKTAPAPEKKKVMYLVPDSSVKKVTSPK